MDFEYVMNQALLLLGNALLLGVGYGLKLLTDWIATKIQNEWAAGIITRTDDLAVKIARDVYQGYVEPIKKAHGRPLKDPEKHLAKKQALDAIKSYLGAKGLNEVAVLLGGANGESLDAYLGSVIENAITRSKNEGDAVKK